MQALTALLILGGCFATVTDICSGTGISNQKPKRRRPLSDRPSASTSELGREKLSCTFDDDDFCGFENDPNSDFEWTQRKGQTASTIIEPRGNNDSYAFLEIAANMRPHATARLRSAPQSAPTLCATISFAYYADGKDLSVEVVSSPDTSKKVIETVFGLTNEPSQSNKQWKTFQTTVALNDVIYQVVFEGEARNDGGNVNYAIDDVVIEADTCPPGLAKKKPPRVSKPIKYTAGSNTAVSDPAIAAISVVVLLFAVVLVLGFIFLIRPQCDNKDRHRQQENNDSRLLSM